MSGDRLDILRSDVVSSCFPVVTSCHDIPEQVRHMCWQDHSVWVLVSCAANTPLNPLFVESTSRPHIIAGVYLQAVNTYIRSVMRSSLDQPASQISVPFQPYDSLIAISLLSVSDGRGRSEISLSLSFIMRPYCTSYCEHYVAF